LYFILGVHKSSNQKTPCELLSDHYVHHDSQKLVVWLLQAQNVGFGRIMRLVIDELGRRFLAIDALPLRKHRSLPHWQLQALRYKHIIGGANADFALFLGNGELDEH